LDCSRKNLPPAWMAIHFFPNKGYFMSFNFHSRHPHFPSLWQNISILVILCVKIYSLTSSGIHQNEPEFFAWTVPMHVLYKMSKKELHCDVKLGKITESVGWIWFNVEVLVHLQLHAAQFHIRSFHAAFWRNLQQKLNKKINLQYRQWHNNHITMMDQLGTKGERHQTGKPLPSWGPVKCGPCPLHMYPVFQMINNHFVYWSYFFLAC